MAEIRRQCSHRQIDYAILSTLRIDKNGLAIGTEMRIIQGRPE